MRQRAAILCFFVPFALALVLGVGAVPGLAQGLSDGSNPADALSQLQQLGRGNGQFGSGMSSGEPQQNPTTLQPALSRNQMPLPPSRLEQIMSQRAGVKLEQFGYDQLGRGRTVTIPQTGAVEDNYILGAGDEVVVSLRGQENLEFRATVDRNGQIVLPRLSPISASGRTFGELRQDIEAAVRRSYVATNAFVSVGRVRQIAVQVSGEVNVPGQRILTGLSTAVDALVLSGGVRKTGSLRNIRIQRGGREYVVDLYSVLTSRGSGSAMALTDGDRILVPPLGPTVAVAGLVRQPGIYELPSRASSISVASLLGLAGGQEVRGRYRLSVMRIEPDGRLDMVSLAGESGVVRDSEILFVQLGADQSVNQATLSGGTGLAGQYPITQGTRLSDVLRAPGAMPPTPYTLFGIISRKDSRTLMRTLIAFTPVAVLTGHEDMPLQSDDIIRVISANEARLLTRSVCTYSGVQAAQQESLRNPLANAIPNTPVAPPSANGSTPAAPPNPAAAQIAQADMVRATAYETCNPNETGSQLVVASAGTGAAAPNTAAQIQRPIVDAFGDPLSQVLAPLPGGQQQALPGQTITGGGPQLSSSPYGYGTGATMDADGLPANNSAYGNGLNGTQSDRNAAPPVLEPTMNFQEQSVRTESYASNKEVNRFSDLARQLNVDEIVLVNFLMDHQATLDGALRGPGSYFIGPNAMLQDLVQAAGGTVNWADQSGVELISTAVDSQSGRAATQRVQLPLRQGMFASYVVKPHDEFRFNKVFTDANVGSVTVQGEVRAAGNYSITRGEHLSDLIARSGGLTNTAYPYGTVFLRKSAASAERQGYNRAASEVENQLVVAMTRIGNDKIDATTFASMQTFVTELRNTPALGRISIAADPSLLAAHPEMDPLLEPGDVVYIPQRPATIAVLGQVSQPGNLLYRPGLTLEDYLSEAGGYSVTADPSQVFIVLPDGSARKVEHSWLKFSSERLPPGSAIVVPRDVTPLDTRQIILDVASIFSQLAVSVASLAVLSTVK